MNNNEADPKQHYMIQKQLDNKLQNELLTTNENSNQVLQKELQQMRTQSYYYLNNTANTHRRGFSAMVAGPYNKKANMKFLNVTSGNLPNSNCKSQHKMNEQQTSIGSPTVSPKTTKYHPGSLKDRFANQSIKNNIFGQYQKLQKPRSAIRRQGLSMLATQDILKEKNNTIQNQSNQLRKQQEVKKQQYLAIRHNQNLQQCKSLCSTQRKLLNPMSYVQFQQKFVYSTNSRNSKSNVLSTFDHIFQSQIVQKTKPQDKNSTLIVDSGVNLDVGTFHKTTVKQNNWIKKHTFQFDCVEKLKGSKIEREMTLLNTNILSMNTSFNSSLSSKSNTNHNEVVSDKGKQKKNNQQMISDQQIHVFEDFKAQKVLKQLLQPNGSPQKQLEKQQEETPAEYLYQNNVYPKIYKLDLTTVDIVKETSITHLLKEKSPMRKIESRFEDYSQSKSPQILQSQESSKDSFVLDDKLKMIDNTLIKEQALMTPLPIETIQKYGDTMSGEFFQQLKNEKTKVVHHRVLTSRKESLSDYENIILKFQDLVDISEFKRSEAILQSGSNKFQKQYSNFAFNFGVICLVQGEFEKASGIFEQIITSEYHSGNDIQNLASNKQIILWSFHNLLFSKLMQIQNQMDQTELQIIQIINQNNELLQLLEFHNLINMRFSIQTDEINFQKMLVFLKQMQKKLLIKLTKLIESNHLQTQTAQIYKIPQKLVQADTYKDLALYQKVKQYQEENGTYKENIDFVVFTRKDCSASSRKRSQRRSARKSIKKVENEQKDHIDFNITLETQQPIQEYYTKQIQIQNQNNIKVNDFKLNNQQKHIYQKQKQQKSKKATTIQKYAKMKAVQAKRFYNNPPHLIEGVKSNDFGLILQNSDSDHSLDHQYKSVNPNIVTETSDNAPIDKNGILPFPNRNPICTQFEHEPGFVQVKKQIKQNQKSSNKDNLADKSQNLDYLKINKVDKCFNELQDLEMSIIMMIQNQNRSSNTVVSGSQERNVNQYKDPFFTQGSQYGIQRNELEDPVYDSTLAIMNNIAILCSEPSIVEAVDHFLMETKGKPPIMSTFKKQKYLDQQNINEMSTAIYILMRTIRGILGIDNLTTYKMEPQQIQTLLNLLKIKIQDGIQQKINQKQKGRANITFQKTAQYVDKLMEQTQKKKAARNKIEVVDDETGQINESSDNDNEFDNISKKLALNVHQIDESHTNLLERKEVKSSARVKLDKYFEQLKPKNEGRVQQFIDDADMFLEDLIQNQSCLFMFQQTYCLTDYIEYAPQASLDFLKELEVVITSIPFKFPILGSEVIDDHTYIDLANQEFIYNREEPAHKLISKSLRVLSHIDSIGLRQGHLKDAIYKKYNLLCLLNYMFKECLLAFYSQDIRASINTGRREIENDSELTQNELDVIKRTKKLKKIDQVLFVDHCTTFKGLAQLQPKYRLQLLKNAEFKTVSDNCSIYDNPDNILYVLKGELTIYLEQTTVFKVRNKTQTKTSRQLFPTQIVPGVALPIMQIRKLEQLKDSKVIIEGNADILLFKNSIISQQFFGPLKRTLMSKIVAQSQLDMLFKANDTKEETNPYIMFVLAIICQVTVHKYSDFVIKAGEIPEGLGLIIEGNAKVVFADEVKREANQSQYCRSYADKPPPFTHVEVSPEKQIIDKNKLAHKDCCAKSKISYVSPKRDKKNRDIYESPSPNKSNQLSTKKQVQMVQKKDTLELKDLHSGHYFSGRVLCDEAVMKNYIKMNKEQILKWIREPISLTIDSVMKQFKTQQKLHQSLESPLKGSKLREDDMEDNLIDLVQQIDLKTKNQTKKDYFIDVVTDETQGINTDKNDNNIFRAFLMSSQLSVIVTSTYLKCMLIRKQDKAYFGESVKKILDDRIAELNFQDIDRPVKQMVKIQKLQQDNHKWNLFKREYQQELLKTQQIERAKQIHLERK